MRFLSNLVMVITAVVLFSGCAITHQYGPYMGKVVDKETNEPIGGAVVFMRFYTLGLFSVSHFADAVEVLTDQNGEFRIPAQRIFVFRPVNWWESYGSTIIFKPGYGAYPGHKDVSPRFKPGGSLPEGQHVTIKLPKLKTIEERKDNLSHLWLGSGVPEGKFVLFEKKKKSEIEYLDRRN